jgi:hypothetical protein
VRDHESDPLIDRVAATLRAPVRVSPAFDERVAAAIRRGPEPLAVRILGWLTAPRPLAVSPLGAIAAAAVLIAVVAGADRMLARRGATPSASVASTVPAAATREQPVQFVFIAPGASSVTVVGDFNDWNTHATPLHQVSEGGAWAVSIELPPGRYAYAFVVDGRRWTPDPLAPRAPQEDFGIPNSVVLVGHRST